MSIIINSKFSLSFPEDEALIALVENNKGIFENFHNKHKDNSLKENILKNISEKSRNIKYLRIKN